MTAMSLSLVTFVAFTMLAVMAFARMLYRLRLYHQLRRPPDVLLVRDVLLFGSFAVVFGMILAVRALSLGPLLVGNVGWVAATSLPVIGAMAYWVFVEYTIIDRDRR